LKRISPILIAAAVIALGALLWSRITPALTLPATVAQWSIAGTQSCMKPAAANFSLWPGTSESRQVCRAEYTGSPAITLTIYDRPGPTAFGLFQEWQTGQRQPGKLAFYYRGYFGVVESPSADMNTLDRFAAAAEETLRR
jgi:hypothetical protein